MAAGHIKIHVSSASDLDESEIGSGAFYVAHIGAQRYRSDTKRVRGGEIEFDDTFTFPLPGGVTEIEFQLWSDDRQDQLIGEGSLRVTQAIEGQKHHHVELRNRNGNQVGKLKVKPDFQGDEDEYRRGTENFQGNPQQYHDNDGVHESDYSERGLFGNKKQQMSKPPQKPGFQGPGQQPGQKDSNVDNILFGVGGAVAAVGAGLVGYGIYEHVKENRNKQGEHGQHGQGGQHQGQGHGSSGGTQGYGSSGGGQGYGANQSSGQTGTQGYGASGGDTDNKYGSSGNQGYGSSNNY